MRNRFRALWRNCGAKSEPDILFETVEKSYSEPHRFYHTLRHIEHCLRQLDILPYRGSDWAAIEFALWYHDIVYVSPATDNEEKSAALADTVCKESGLPESFRAAARELILITRHVEEPRYFRKKLGNDNVFFNVGIDEHGQKVFTTAKESGTTPEKFLDGLAPKWKDFCSKFRIGRNSGWGEEGDSGHAKAREGDPLSEDMML